MKVRHLSVVIGRASGVETIACVRGGDMKLRQTCVVTERNSKCRHVCVVRETPAFCDGERRLCFMIHRYNDDKSHVFCDGERR